MVTKQAVHVEVVLHPTSHVSPSLVSQWLEKRLSSGVSVFQNGSLPSSCYATAVTDTAEHQIISSSILKVVVVDLLPSTSVSFWQVRVVWRCVKNMCFIGSIRYHSIIGSHELCIGL
jgi:hypothetical protein